METHKAYAHGVLDGYSTGYESNNYDRIKEVEKYKAYKDGYDYGVFLYTQEGHDEVNND
jgi:hypothetical protein